MPNKELTNITYYLFIVLVTATASPSLAKTLRWVVPPLVLVCPVPLLLVTSQDDPAGQ